MLFSRTTEFALVQQFLKFLEACWGELMSYHPQRPVYSLTFVVMLIKLGIFSFTDGVGYYN